MLQKMNVEQKHRQTTHILFMILKYTTMMEYYTVISYARFAIISTCTHCNAHCEIRFSNLKQINI